MKPNALIFLFLLHVPAVAQEPLTLTAEQDRQIMMEKLGIQRLRSGPSPDSAAPNGANYDEAMANPFPELPDPLTMNDGRRVTSPELWWSRRRPEIVEAQERDVYGRVPDGVPKVHWEVEINEREYVGFLPVTAKRLVGRVDNSAYPLVDVEIKMTVVTPANAEGPVPLLMMFGPSRLPAPAQPPQEDLDRINAALKTLLVQADSSVREVFDRYRAFEPVRSTPSFPYGARESGAAASPTQLLLSAGWGYAYLDPVSVQADNGPGLTRGIIGLVNRGQPRDPDDWGALRAWAWGASRGLDYLETDPAVDADRVGIEGVSRYGKAALVALAFDRRFAMGLIGSSGKGGATLHRRNFGEAVESLAGSGYYWMAGNYLKYAAAEADFGPGNAGQLPTDSHELIALAAPRLVLISYGIPEQGDAKWLDHQGSFMAAVAAQPVFELLGARGLGVPDDYRAAEMPPVGEGLLGGHLAWRQHDGGHTATPNIPYFIEWAERMLDGTPAGQ